MTCRHSFELGPHGIGDAAMEYARLGYAVVPLVRGGKKPHKMLPATGGVHHASRDPAQIREWWGTDPAANAGVATGSVNGLAVIDLDMKGAGNGVHSFFDFLWQNGLAMPIAPYVQTPNGGLHIWLRVPAGQRVPERPGILPGVDVKGDGGLVAAPPSAKLHVPLSRPGEQPSAEPVPIPYWWTDACPCQVPMAPAWLLGWLRDAPALGGGGDRGDRDGADWGDEPDVEAALAHGFERGYRNVSMYRLACSLYRRHNGPEGPVEVWKILTDVWNAGDTSDMDLRELAVIAASARRFVEVVMASDEAIHQHFMATYIDRRQPWPR